MDFPELPDHRLLQGLLDANLSAGPAAARPGAWVSSSVMHSPPPAAVEEVVWDLDHLVDGEAGVDAALDEATERADRFAERYRGALAEIDASDLREAMDELARINELVGRAGSYAQLRFSTDTADPSRRALMQRVEERGTALETTLLFFELEWAAVDDDRAEELLAADGLDFCRHYLRNARRYRPHLLSEPEERIFAEKAHDRAQRLGAAVRGADLGDRGRARRETVTLDEALSRLAAPDREVRRASAEAVTPALAPGLRTRAFIFNTLLPTRRPTTGCAPTPTGWPAATWPTRRATSRSPR